MAKYIAQLRYYGDNSNQNYPGDLTANDLLYGRAFVDYSPIIQLGIQTSPTIEYNNVEGEKVIIHPSFYINGGSGSIQIGKTGIYELDLTGLSMIEELTFSKDFIDAINIYNSQNAGEGAHLMVDIIYEG